MKEERQVVAEAMLRLDEEEGFELSPDQRRLFRTLILIAYRYGREAEREWYESMGCFP